LGISLILTYSSTYTSTDRFISLSKRYWAATHHTILFVSLIQYSFTIW
jgi:hypothetical protein